MKLPLHPVRPTKCTVAKTAFWVAAALLVGAGIRTVAKASAVTRRPV